MNHAQHAPQSHTSGSQLSIDPVCSMQVSPATTSVEPLTYEGTEYFFCCPHCRTKFADNPEHYLTLQAAAGHQHSHTQHDHQDAAAEAVDPVCGMNVAITPDTPRTVFRGQDYYFCMPHCRERFLAAPESFLSESDAEPPAAAEGNWVCPMCPEVRELAPGACPSCGMALEPESVKLPDDVIYVCPMHPEVSQAAPGDCPICGMALEPKNVQITEQANPELADMQRRFKWSLALTLPLFLLSLGEMLFANLFHGIGTPQQWVWLQLVLVSPVVLWGGWPFFKRGWTSVVRRSLNMFTLIALGTGVAYVYSVVATLAPGIFPAVFRTAAGVVPVYFEAAGVIITLVLLGQVLELGARDRTGNAIRSLLKLSPQNAILVAGDGKEQTVALSQVMIGDHLRVRSGDKIPVDGIILEGTSYIDESAMTGEPFPVQKSDSDPVTGGTLNGEGSFIMEAQRVGSNTLLARIVQMVSEAQRSRAPIQRLVDSVAAYFVPIVLVISVITFIVWAVIGPQPALGYALVNAIAVLIIACPCALGLATPMSIMVGVGRGALEGVLIRDAESLETMEKIDTLVLDKTGTLTEGRPALAHVTLTGKLSEDEAIQIAASLEQASEHPIGKAFVAAAAERNLELQKPTHVHSISGKGIEGTVGKRKITLGSGTLARERGDADPGAGQEVQPALDSATWIVMLIDDHPVAQFAVTDRIKATTPEAIRELHNEGIRIVMLTGDDETTAKAVAAQLGIDEVLANVLPDEKGAAIQRLQQQGAIVAMAGDGVNDAPALALADLGIAMGTGTDIAMESAGITLVKGDLRGILKALRLSRGTMRNIRQNLFWAFGYNTAGIPIAAGVLYPVFGLLLSPIIAAAAMSFSSVTVIANALRLRRLSL